MRRIISLMENWSFTKQAEDAADAVKKAAQEAETVTLPHTWNAVDGQDGGNDYYRGTCWYVTELDVPDKKESERVYLEFNGAAMTATVYLNGKQMAYHEGGYSTFRVDVTEELKNGNVLAVSVDNSDNDRVYPQKADFTFYGGLYRSVNLLVVPEAHFTLDYAGGPGIQVTPEVQGTDAKVTVETWVTGPAEQVTVFVGEDAKEAKVENGYAKAVFEMKNVHLWNGRKDPYLYTAKAVLDSKDSVSTRFGCRTFEVDPEKGFILNGKVYPLRGVSRHQDRKGVGNALTYDMHEEDMEIIKEIGANTIRLAHYQHAQEFYDLCDANGMIVWAEIPYITQHMPNGRENTLSQMKELIVQNYNHPSIVCWGLSNEITASGGVTDDLLINHRLLNELCHELDATRFTVMADVFMLEIDSPILEIPDVNSYNLYFGWYLGDLKQNDEFFDEYHEKYPDRCIGFSEYGADANPQYQSSHPEKGDYTETYQAAYHEHMAEMIEQRPYLWATHVWNLFDFAADGRDEGGKHGENQKGLVTMDRKLKKDAFYLYKSYWNKEDAFVHLCGSRYIDRAEEETEIKVYSNQPEVTLYVDGIPVETQAGGHVFRFRIPVSGEHHIKAAAGNCQDEIQIRKVDKVNPEYVLGEVKAVVNWFDRDEIKEGYFSIYDTLGELEQHPVTGQIVGQMMANNAASRGDVAESVKDNPALKKMMAKMTLESMLKQVRDLVSDEQVKQLNDALQKIKKPVEKGC